jgi:hypothetical protein
VYDMYHWHRIDAGTDDSARRTTGATASTAHRGAPPRHANGGGPGGGHAHGGSPAAGPAVQAVQVALDLRDNGGDLAAARDE